jgi:hypothetical protein
MTNILSMENVPLSNHKPMTLTNHFKIILILHDDKLCKLLHYINLYLLSQTYDILILVIKFWSPTFYKTILLDI